MNIFNLKIPNLYKLQVVSGEKWFSYVEELH